MFSIESAIRERLAALPGSRGVFGIPDGEADLSGRPLPSVFVMFHGYTVLETIACGKEARVASRWLVLVVAKSAANIRDGQPARSLAAPVVDAVLGALMGWRPAPEYTPLELVDAPASQYREGLMTLPLAFVTEHVVAGAS